jgi:hypothetical protein
MMPPVEIDSTATQRLKRELQTLMQNACPPLRSETKAVIQCLANA